MEPKPQDKEEKPPSPVIVLLISLFGYPGGGHFMVGARGLGVALAVVFTGLTLGLLYEMWVLLSPLYEMYQQGAPMQIAPNWARIGFWVGSTGIVWIATGVHSYVLAKRLS